MRLGFGIRRLLLSPTSAGVLIRAGTLRLT
jgi:hypothetical protein